MMRPNQTYLEHFSDLFQAHERDHVSIGLYAAVSVIAEQNGLKACLENVFGPKRTKSILDYAMYAVSCQSSVSPYSAKMARNQVFSDRNYPDSYWSVFFDRQITKEEMDRFKELWVLQCTRNGISTGYVSWDGSSKDGNRKDAEEANPGKTTLGTGGSQYGILYGVAPDGTPVTYDVYDGNVPDHAAIKTVVQFLEKWGISVAGAIIDRGLDDLNSLEDLLTIADDVVVRLKENTAGFKNAVMEKGEEVRKCKSSLRIPHERLFGDSVKSAFFNNCDPEEWVHLFYDFQSGGESAFALLDEIDGAIEDIREKAEEYIEYEKKWEKDKAKKKEKKPFSVTIPAKLKNVLTLKGTTPYDIEAVKNEEEIRREVLDKGLYAIGTHSEMTAERANHLYKLREVTEKCVDLISTLPEFDRIPAKSEKSMQSRMFIAFIAAIITTEIARASREAAGVKHSADPQNDIAVTIDRLLSVAMTPLSDGTYGLQHRSISGMMPIFEKLNVEKEYLETVARKYNQEMQKKKEKQEDKKIKEKRRKDTSDKRAGQSENSEETETSKSSERPRGRPPKNKEESEEKPRRPRGRPPKARDRVEEQKPKRPRGRPPKAKPISDSAAT